MKYCVLEKATEKTIKLIFFTGDMCLNLNRLELDKAHLLQYNIKPQIPVERSITVHVLWFV